jgi:hypothetical protein
LGLGPDLGILNVDFLVLSCVSALSSCSYSWTYLSFEFLAKFLDTIFPGRTGDLGWLDLANVIDHGFSCGGYHSVVLPSIDWPQILLTKKVLSCQEIVSWLVGSYITLQPRACSQASISLMAIAELEACLEQLSTSTCGWLSAI